jgi:hypothetical protein
MIQFSFEAIQKRAVTDQAAFELLRDQLEPAIQAATRLALGKRSWRRFADDARQGAELGLWLAVRSDQADLPQEDWQRFAFSLMRHHARAAVRQLDRQREANSISDREALEQSSTIQLDHLPREVQQVASILATGQSQRATANALGITRWKVSTAVQQIRGAIE